ncbi:S24 family peptidase [Massilia sp. R798]|uniref:S24 family peptidase n=2 Tax=Massilia soli TaxID=2792854 RepID=A0ABS7SMV5_9BURK|nr:S24 family peptidase [Massilia soli]
MNPVALIGLPAKSVLVSGPSCGFDSCRLDYDLGNICPAIPGAESALDDWNAPLLGPRAASQQDRYAPDGDDFSHQAAPDAAGAYCGDMPGTAARVMRNRASSYALRVHDDAMEGAGILSGDVVIIDRSLVAEHGQIVVALIGERYLIARLFRFNGRMELRSQRAGREASRLAVDAEPFVWGVVVGVVRSYAAGAS